MKTLIPIAVFGGIGLIFWIVAVVSIFIRERISGDDDPNAFEKMMISIGMVSFSFMAVALLKGCLGLFIK